MDPEKDSSGNIIEINLSNETLTIAKNTMTNVRFRGFLYTPKDMQLKDFDPFFSWKYLNKKAVKKLTGLQISWTSAYNIQAENPQENNTSIRKHYKIFFGTAEKLIYFKAKRKVYHPIVNGSGFNLIEMEAPSLSECMNALTEGKNSTIRIISLIKEFIDFLLENLGGLETENFLIVRDTAFQPKIKCIILIQGCFHNGEPKRVSSEHS